MIRMVFCTMAALLSGTAGVLAQVPGGGYTPLPGSAMPGQIIGSSLPAANVSPVGTRFPGAVPTVGTPVGRGPGGAPTPLDPRMSQPPGQPINLQNVIAPYPMPPSAEPNFWDRLYIRWAMLFQEDGPALPVTNWTPGIGRRNRERKNMWRRD